MASEILDLQTETEGKSINHTKDLSNAVVPSLYISFDGCCPHHNLQTILSAEVEIQTAVNNFRSRGNDNETVHHSVADGLRKHRLLTDHGNQVTPGDLIDLNDLDDFIHYMCDQLHILDTEYNHMYDMIPVEIDRQIGELYSRLYEQVAEEVRKAQEKSLKKLDLLEEFYDEQYDHAVASLLRWWKRYDEMLINNFQKTACLADDDAHAIVRKHRKQMGLHKETIERINKQSIALKNHLAELNNPKGLNGESRSRDNVADAKFDFSQMSGIIPQPENLAQKYEDEIVATLIEIHPLKEEKSALEVVDETNQKILADKQAFLSQLTTELAALKREHRKTLDDLHFKLQEERRSLQETRDDHDKLLNQLVSPLLPDPDEIAEENDLRYQIEQTKQKQFRQNQQLRLVQLELRSIDRMYDQRFQQLQKIGFMLRNETYVRRTLERKFFKNANYLNLKELLRMEGSGKEDRHLDEQDLYGTESVAASGDQLEGHMLRQSLKQDYEEKNSSWW